MTKGLISLPAFCQNKNILQGTTKVSLGDFNYFHGADRRAVVNDIKRLKALIGAKSLPLVLGQQIHGRKIAVVKVHPARPISYYERTDALITCRSGVLLGILTADCVPVFLYDRERKVIGVVHAGWRGVTKEIVPGTLKLMSRYYCTRPEAVIAGLGPYISRSHYQVDKVTAGKLGVKASGNLKIDLGLLIRRQLVSAGLKAGNITKTGFCTYGSPQLFSFRRQREKAGRMLSFLLIK